MRTISVVDDDPSVRKALSRLLRVAGYTSAAYESAEAFVEAGGAEISDCVILDVHLSGLSGLELQAQLVRSHASCPVLFMTAFNDDSARAQALEAGAVEFLRKPLDIGCLLEVIRTALDR